VKQILFTALILLLSTSLSYSQKTVEKMVDQMKKTKRYEGVEIPGYLIRTIFKFATIKDNTLKEKSFYRIVSKIKKATIATTTLEQKKYDNKAIINNFVTKLISDDKYEEYITIKENGQVIRILMKVKDDVIKNLLIISQEGREISLIHLKTKLKISDLKDLNFGEVNTQLKGMKSSDFNDEF
jgi:hypothetical protein